MRALCPAVVAAALGLALACPPAGAEEGAAAAGAGGTVGRLRLELGLGALGYTHMQTDGAVETIEFTDGLAPVSGVAFGIGRALTDRFSLGVRLLFGFSALRDNGYSTDTHVAFGCAALPYLEHAFGAGRVRPYLAVLAGFDGAVARSQREGHDSGGAWSEVSVGFLALGAVGLGGGLRVFLAERISLEIWALELVGFGALHEENRDRGESSDRTEFAWRSRTELFVGVTGWI